MEIPVNDCGDTTGIVVRRCRFDGVAPATYSETLYGGVSEWFEFLAKRSIVERRGVPIETLEQFYEGWQPMGYETTQERRCEVWRDGKLRCLICITVYRLPSGRYEVTAYIS